jgi:hypothetical protein
MNIVINLEYRATSGRGKYEENPRLQTEYGLVERFLARTGTPIQRDSRR